MFVECLKKIVLRSCVFLFWIFIFGTPIWAAEPDTNLRPARDAIDLVGYLETLYKSKNPETFEAEIMPKVLMGLKHRDPKTRLLASRVVSTIANKNFFLIKKNITPKIDLSNYPGLYLTMLELIDDSEVGNRINAVNFFTFVHPSSNELINIFNSRWDKESSDSVKRDIILYFGVSKSIPRQSEKILYKGLNNNRSLAMAAKVIGKHRTEEGLYYLIQKLTEVNDSFNTRAILSGIKAYGLEAKKVVKDLQEHLAELREKESQIKESMVEISKFK